MHTVKPPFYLTPMSAEDTVVARLDEMLLHVDALEAWVSTLSPAMMPDSKKMVFLARLELMRSKAQSAREVFRPRQP